MKREIISSILISCMLIQILLTHIGCMSFYPTDEDNNLSKYSNYEGKILLKLKDKTELNISPKNTFFIDKPSELVFGIGEEYNYADKKISNFMGIIENNKINSTRLFNEYNPTPHYVYWMNDKRRLSFKEEKIFSITADSGCGFWVVVDNNKVVFRKIYDADIEEIQVLKTNWIATSILILLGISLIALGITASSFSGVGNFSGSGGW